MESRFITMVLRWEIIQHHTPTSRHFHLASSRSVEVLTLQALHTTDPCFLDEFVVLEPTNVNNRNTNGKEYGVKQKSSFFELLIF